MLWLSPVYPSPQDDAGYDISDYQDIDPTFGTLDDFDALLAGVHERGMKLVMDLVVNHTSDEHPWFAESRSSRDNPKRDWYWWRAQPNNWGSFFSGSAWELDPLTGEHYLHLFSRKQPDLNWENPEVRAAIYAMMNWWLDRGVDGFRMDVIDLISKDPALPDGELRDGRALRRRHPAHELRPADPRVPGRDAPRGVRRARRRAADGRRDADRDARGGAAVHRPGARRARHGLPVRARPARPGRDQVGPAAAAPARPQGLARRAGRRGWRTSAGTASTGTTTTSRAPSRASATTARTASRAAKMLGTVLHLHRGTPYVYQGEELGMTNAPWAGIEDFRDIETLNHYAEAVANGADPDAVLDALRAAQPRQRAHADAVGRLARTPASRPARRGCRSTRTTREINAAAARADPDSVFHHYRRLIELRHTEPVVAHGDFTMLLPDDERVYAFTRRLGDVELLVLGNFSGEPAPELPDADALGRRRGARRRAGAGRRAGARALGGPRAYRRRNDAAAARPLAVGLLVRARRRGRARLLPAGAARARRPGSAPPQRDDRARGVARPARWQVLPDALGPGRAGRVRRPRDLDREHRCATTAAGTCSTPGSRARRTAQRPAHRAARPRTTWCAGSSRACVLEADPRWYEHADLARPLGRARRRRFQMLVTARAGAADRTTRRGVIGQALVGRPAQLGGRAAACPRRASSGTWRCRSGSGSAARGGSCSARRRTTTASARRGREGFVAECGTHYLSAGERQGPYALDRDDVPRRRSRSAAATTPGGCSSTRAPGSSSPGACTARTAASSAS